MPPPFLGKCIRIVFFLHGQSRNRVANVYTELSDRVEKAATLMINDCFSCRAHRPLSSLNPTMRCYKAIGELQIEVAEVNA